MTKLNVVLQDTAVVSIILPTYNEAGNILELIREIKKTVKGKKEIIVVDDNSPDGTAKLVKKDKQIKLVLRTENRGLTNSLRDGIKVATGDIIVWMDCDFSHPPEIINLLLTQISGASLRVKKGADIAVASRFVKNGGFIVPEGDSKDSWVAILLSRYMNYAISLLLSKKFKDYTSGFIAARKTVFKKITLRGDYGEYFIDLIYKALLLNYKVVEVPYVQDVRRAGESKTGQNLGQYLKRGSKYLVLTLRLIMEKNLHQIP